MKQFITLTRITCVGALCVVLLLSAALVVPSAALLAQAFPSPTPTMTMTTTPTFVGDDPFAPLTGTPGMFPTPDTGFALPSATAQPALELFPSPTPPMPPMPPTFAEPTATPLPTSLDALPGRFSSGARLLARVNTESLYVRRLPTTESEHIASLFDDEIVQVVSRNLDGSWFEVRRIGRMNSLGWALNDLLEWDLLPEALPLGDISVGVNGPVPLSSAPQYGVYLEEAPVLRELPLRDGRRIMVLPPLVVVPVVARNQDASWLQVNYFGFQGWINRVSIRERGDVDWTTLPVPPGLPPPDSVPVVVIPVEIQQAQIDRLRAFIGDRRELAAALEAFWWSVYRGEIMPCNAPAEVTSYPYSDSDIRELPELGRYVPRLVTAVNYLSAAREPLLTCGVVSPSITVAARNSAINARVVFDAVTQALDNLENTIRQYR